jgi:hypothetical protein
VSVEIIADFAAPVDGVFAAIALNPYSWLVKPT